MKGISVPFIIYSEVPWPVKMTRVLQESNLMKKNCFGKEKKLCCSLQGKKQFFHSHFRSLRLHCVDFEWWLCWQTSFIHYNNYKLGKKSSFSNSIGHWNNFSHYSRCSAPEPLTYSLWKTGRPNASWITIWVKASGHLTFFFTVAWWCSYIFPPS